MKKATFVVVGAVLLAVGLIGCSSNGPSVPSTVATVNGQSIPSSVYLDQVSRRYGQDLLRNMIEQKIVLQWADEEKVAPTEEQVNKQIETLKNEGTYEDQVKGLGEDGLKSEASAMQARINLARKFLSVSDAEVGQAYEAMKTRYVHPARKQVALIVNTTKSSVEDAAKSVKGGKDFNEAAAEFSSRQFAMRGPVKIWVEEGQASLPKPLVDAAKKTKLDEVSNVFTLSSPQSPALFALLKVVADQPKIDKKLKDVKTEVEDMALLQKSQMDQDFVKKLNERMKDAKIEIGIPEFKDIALQFKNPPEPMPSMMSSGPPPSAKPAPKGN